MFTIFRAALSAALILSGLSCTADTPQGIAVGTNIKRPEAHAVFGDAIVLQDSDFILIPFWTQTNVVQQKQSDLPPPSAPSFAIPGSLSESTPLSRSFGQYDIAQSVHWNNVAFFQRSTGQSRLLLNRPSVIVSAYLPNNSPAVATDAAHPSDAKKPARPKVLLFAVAEHDTNGDGYINGEDAVVLYSCDFSGENLTRLTPDGTQLTGIVPDGEDALCARVLYDSNGDHHFTADDQAMLYRIDLRHPAEGQAMISEPVRKGAEEIVERR